MKKFGWILCGALLLVGCSPNQMNGVLNEQSEVSFVEDIVTTIPAEGEEQEAKGESQYYVRNEKVWQQMAEIGQQLHQKEPNIYYDSSPSGYNLTVEWETIEQLGVPLSQSEYGKALEQVYPGILAFIKEVEAETTDKAPQSTVINGGTIKMIPMHLYNSTVGTSRNQSYLQITNDGVILEDAYFKKLAEATPEDRFVISEPYLTGVNQMLRMSTPAFENRSYMGQYQTDNFVKPEVTYETNALGYQLYVSDNQLQKVRVTGRRLTDENLDQTLFEPLLKWCQEEFGMTQDQLQVIQSHIPEIASGQVDALEESLGAYTLKYKIYDQQKLYVVGDSGQKEQLFELTIGEKNK